MSGGEGYVIVRVARVAGRRTSTHRSEMVTQWMCGELLQVQVETERGWMRVRGPDGYESWVTTGGLHRPSPEEADRWSRKAVARSLGITLQAAEEAVREGDEDSHFLPFLPWGARCEPLEGDEVRLPDGRRARPAGPGAVLGPEERRRRFPARGRAVARTARRWRGVPYLWGGRSLAGVDCSGLVQAVYGMHGVRLPRDSRDQWEAGPEVDPSGQIVAGGPAAREEAPGGADAPRVRTPGEPPSREEAERWEPGDLLFFGGGEEGSESVEHVALWAGGGRMIHAAAAHGQVVEEPLMVGRGLAARLQERLVAVTRPLSLR